MHASTFLFFMPKHLERNERTADQKKMNALPTLNQGPRLKQVSKLQCKTVSINTAAKCLYYMWDKGVVGPKMLTR